MFLILLGGLALAALMSFFYGLILMLTVGIVHDHWIPSVPTIGYWAAVVVAYTIRSLFTDTRVS